MKKSQYQRNFQHNFLPHTVAQPAQNFGEGKILILGE